MSDGVPAEPEFRVVSDRRDDELIAMWLYGRPLSTQAVYGPIVREFIVFVSKPLVAVSVADLQAFHSTLSGLAPTTQSKKLSAIKSLLTYAHKTGFLAVNVGVVLQMPKLRNTLAERILTEDDVHRLIDLEPLNRNKLLIRLLYLGGLRRDEIRSLRVRDMRRHGKAGKLTVFGKGSKTRTVPLPPGIWSDLSCFVVEMERDDPVFQGSSGKPLSPKTIWRIVKAAGERAGLGTSISPHFLRHSHSSHALDHGCPIHVLQSVLGHASVATTSRYLHVNSSESSGDYLSDTSSR